MIHNLTGGSDWYNKRGHVTPKGQFPSWVSPLMRPGTSSFRLRPSEGESVLHNSEQTDNVSAGLMFDKHGNLYVRRNRAACMGTESSSRSNHYNSALRT